MGNFLNFSTFPGFLRTFRFEEIPPPVHPLLPVTLFSCHAISLLRKYERNLLFFGVVFPLWFQGGAGNLLRASGGFVTKSEGFKKNSAYTDIRPILTNDAHLRIYRAKYFTPAQNHVSRLYKKRPPEKRPAPASIFLIRGILLNSAIPTRRGVVATSMRPTDVVFGRVCRY